MVTIRITRRIGELLSRGESYTLLSALVFVSSSIHFTWGKFVLNAS